MPNVIVSLRKAPTIVITPMGKLIAVKSQRVPLCGDFCFFFTVSIYYGAIYAFFGSIRVLFFSCTHVMLLFSLFWRQIWLRKGLGNLTNESIEELRKTVTRAGHIRMFTALYGFTCIWLVIEKEETFKFYLGVILSLIGVWYSGLMYCFNSGTSDILENIGMAVKRETTLHSIRASSRLIRVE